MTVYHQVFFPILAVGLSIAVIASYFAARKSGFLVPAALFLVGVVALWAALFLGSEFGYRAWQSIPDPPAVAFSDTAPLGALLLGWLPAGVFCGFVVACVRLVRHLGSRGTTEASAS